MAQRRTKSLRNCETLRDVLVRFVADADFLKFDEYGKHKGRPGRKDVVENASMLKEIIRIAPMLAATLTCIQACMLQIATDKHRESACSRARDMGRGGGPPLEEALEEVPTVAHRCQAADMVH